MVRTNKDVSYLNLLAEPITFKKVLEVLVFLMENEKTEIHITISKNKCVITMGLKND